MPCRCEALLRGCRLGVREASESRQRCRTMLHCRSAHWATSAVSTRVGGRRVCRVGPGEFHPEPLTDPYVSLSTYTARATARRLPPSVEQGAHPGKPVGPNQPRWPASFAPAPLQRLHLLRGSPPLSGASVLSASRLEPLAPFPLPSPARFCRSVPEPGRASRRLHAGCRLGSIRTSPKLIPEVGSTPGFDIT